MLLAIDVGNSNITVGLFRDEVLVSTFRMETAHARTSDEYGLTLESLVRRSGHDAQGILDAVIASVVPTLTRTMEIAVERTFGRAPVVVGPGIKTQMPILYDPPKDVGADRIVNAVAAFARFKSACIVVDFGTATTFDSISDRGEYAGGAIAPGIQIAAEALFARAAKLPRVEVAKPRTVIGKNTVESMQAGIYFGYVALVDGIVKRMRLEMKSPVVHVIATGGLASTLASDSETIEAVDDALTLEGLRLIYDHNRPRTAGGSTESVPNAKGLS